VAAVQKHGVVVLARFFHMENDGHLQTKGELDQIVLLEQGAGRIVGKANPEILQTHPVWARVHYIHASTPHGGVVAKDPALLSKTNEFARISQIEAFGEGMKAVFDCHGAGCGVDNYPERNKIQVLNSDRVQCALAVLQVGELCKHRIRRRQAG